MCVCVFVSVHESTQNVGVLRNSILDTFSLAAPSVIVFIRCNINDPNFMAVPWQNKLRS